MYTSRLAAGTNVPLLNGLCNLMIKAGHIDLDYIQHIRLDLSSWRRQSRCGPPSAWSR